MAGPGSSPASSSPASSSPAAKYDLLTGTKYQRYLDLRERLAGGQSVGNTAYVQDLVSDIKDNIRFLGDIPSTSPKYAEARAQQAQLRSLRNELISLRNQRGIEPEEPLPPPRVVPLEQQPVKTPFGTFYPGNTPFEQIQRGQGIGKSVQRNLKKYEQTRIQDPASELTEIRLTSFPLAGPSPLELGESFVMGLNAQFGGQQVVIGQRVGDTYQVQYNPAISKSGFVDELVEERLTSYGYSSKDGKFVYSEPSYQIISSESPEFAAPSGFDFAEPFFYDSEREIPVLEAGGTRFSEAERKAVTEKLLAPGKFAAEDPFSGEMYVLGTQEETFFSPSLTLQRQFYRADFSKGIGEFFADIEDKSGGYIKESPVGEIRLSQGLEYIAGTAEDVIKPFPAAGTVFGGTIAGSNPFATEEQRQTARGNVYAAYPDFIKLPTAVTTIMILGSSPKVSAKAPPNIGSTKVVSTTMTPEGYLAQEFRRGASSFSYTLKTPPGAPGYGILKAKVAIEPFFQLGSKAAGIGGGILRPAVTGVKFGTATATIQAGAEVLGGGGPQALFTEGAQSRIKGAFIGGGLIGAGIETYQTFKPLIDKAAKGAGQVAVRVKEAPFTAANEVIEVPFKAAQVAKYGYFLAGSASASISPLTKQTPGIIRPASFTLVAEATRRGANPFVLVKPSTRELPTVTRLPPNTRPSAILSPSLATRTPQQRFRMQETKRDRELFAPEIRQEIREDAIQRDIQREAGKLRIEQLETLKQGVRPGFGFKTRTRLEEGVKEGQRQREDLFTGQFALTRTPEMPRLKEPERPRLKVFEQERIRQTTPEIPRIPSAIPVFVPVSGGGKKQKKVPTTIGQSFRYAPSLTGILTGKRETRRKKSYTGFEIRGLPKLRRGTNVVL